MCGVRPSELVERLLDVAFERRPGERLDELRLK